MPDKSYHSEKRDRFRDCASFLERSNKVYTYDPCVQDNFYSMMHEAERFLAEINIHSSSHRGRERYITNYMIKQRGALQNRADYNRNPVQPADRLFDNRSGFFYMQLLSLRLNIVYGDNRLGPLRHATRRDVERAKQLRENFQKSINRHERSLRRKRII